MMEPERSSNGKQRLAGRLGSWIGRPRTLLVTLLAAFAGLFIVTALATIPFMHRENTRAVFELTEDLIVHITDMMIDKTEGYLRPAEVMTELTAQLMRDGVVSMADEGELERYGVEAVKGYPQLAMCNVGDEHGNFLMSKKMPDGTIATKIIRRTASPPELLWKYRDAEGKVVRLEESSEIDYDPRVRPWYEAARETGDTRWSDVYAFFTDKRPGISVSHPVLNDGGELVGVVGIDIELWHLSEFLEEKVTIGESGVTVILTEKGEVVAHSESPDIVREGRDGYRPALLAEVGPDWVVRAHREHLASREDWFFFESGDERYIASFRAFPSTIGRSWKLGIVARDDEFIGALRRTRRQTLLIAALLLLLVAAPAAFLLARSISKPVVTLTEETVRIKELDLDGDVDIRSPIREIQVMSDGLVAMKSGLGSFRRYVPAQLVRELVQTGEQARLGGETRELTIMFSDIEGFTGISEEMPAQELVIQLSEYFDELTRILMEQRGTVDKYIGDGILAFWGAPVPREDHAACACRAVLRCGGKVNELNARWEAEGRPMLRTRFGIHTGDTVVGNIGSEERMNYSVVGESVNHASRLEGINKLHGTDVAVSADTRNAAGDRFIFRPLDVLAVGGKPEGMRIFELVAEVGSAEAARLQGLCEQFATGFEAYLAGEWNRAIAVFEDILQRFPEDEPAKLLATRCREFRERPPDGPHWEQLIHLDSKH